MSRIGNKVLVVPDGVKVALAGEQITVEGPQGQLVWRHRPEISVRVDDAGKQISVSRSSDERTARAYHGLTRSVINNMLQGVKTGYEKRLEIVGVGYQASLQGDTLSLRVGLANEIKRKVPAGLKVTCPDATHIVVRGCDKQLVGQFAAEVRASRKPEPYKGKGVRYQGEQVKIKPGKAAT